MDLGFGFIDTILFRDIEYLHWQNNITVILVVIITGKVEIDRIT